MVCQPSQALDSPQIHASMANLRPWPYCSVQSESSGHGSRSPRDSSVEVVPRGSGMIPMIQALDLWLRFLFSEGDPFSF